jgi:thioredoxin 1
MHINTFIFERGVVFIMQGMATGKIRNVNDDNFDSEVLKSEIPVMVDFYADWCGPCKIVEPTMETLSKEYSGKVKFVKVNVDDNQGVSMKYDIMSIPTAILFENGEIKDSLIGAFPAASYRQRLDHALKE